MNNKGFTVIMGVVVMIIVLVGISFIVFFSKSGNVFDSSHTPDPIITPSQTENPDPQGTIRIEAKDGQITAIDKYDTSTYLAETSRGFEAYLAYKEAQVTIPFSLEKSQSGTYSVLIYTSDDGLWSSGDRNATIFFDASQKLLYQHKSEDTKGMVWIDLGVVSLTEGDHYIQVAKQESTGAAFAFTSIKLVPLKT